MGEIFRSQEMELIQIFVQLEAAHDTIDELGKLAQIQFKDLNPEVNAFQRNFVSDVKRFDEMERKMNFFEDQVKKQRENGLLSEFCIEQPDPRSLRADELEGSLEELEKELIQLNTNAQALNRNLNELVEYQHVLLKDSAFFTEQGHQENDIMAGSYVGEKSSLLEPDEELQIMPTIKSAALGFITGVIAASKIQTFERILWRATRGNLYMKYSEISEPICDPSSGENVQKDVFTIFFHGERAQQKIRKICESFGANLYQVSQNPGERSRIAAELDARLRDLKEVVSRSRDHQKRVIENVRANLEKWKHFVLKEKAIYHTLNLFNYDLGRRTLIGEGWVPKASLDAVAAALKIASDRSGVQVPTVMSRIEFHEDPPTSFKTNKFTRVFQSIVDSYGVARYREINPTPFIIITFPFLFAVMFGDVGHGIFLFLAALFFITREQQLQRIQLNEMIEMIFDGRYLIILMGLFSIYAGFLYNDVFGIPIDFGSNWAYQESNSTTAYQKDPDFVYGFGVDPGWKGAKNELAFMNSLKMKLSIILGVSQMVLGIFLKLLNDIYFKKPYNIYFEFIPQLLFMLSLFGYLCLIVIIKWGIDWQDRTPPSLLIVMIDIFLSFFSLKDSDYLYDNQLQVQQALVIIAVICVPIMLFVKPFLLRRDHSLGKEVTEHGEEFEFSEVLVHQVIHSIEFILGAISNTASYLRLWALSLAHAQLSVVFLDLIFVLALKKAISSGGFIMMFVAFAVWASLTVGVLLLMEAMSAFLHALRLHWVEFQSKFYHGDGRAFLPLDLSKEKILNRENSEN